MADFIEIEFIRFCIRHHSRFSNEKKEKENELRRPKQIRYAKNLPKTSHMGTGLNIGLFQTF